MRRFMLSLAAAGLLASSAMAQEPTPADPMGAPAVHAEPSVSAEMWLLQQQRRDAADPAVAVRKNAALRGKQRRERLESRRWYGYSVARPMANAVPHMSSTYSPDWQGNAGYPQMASPGLPLVR